MARSVFCVLRVPPTQLRPARLVERGARPTAWGPRLHRAWRGSRCAGSSTSVGDSHPALLWPGPGLTQDVPAAFCGTASSHSRARIL